MVNCGIFLYPYRDINGKYLGLPENFNMDYSNLICIKISPNSVTKVTEFDYNWIKVHPVQLIRKYNFEII